jgi:hypothetical protein
MKRTQLFLAFKNEKMKKIIIGIIVVVACLQAKAQSATAQAIANKMANRMKDSLVLSDAQRDSVYSINIRLHNQKMSMRTNYTGTDSLTRKIQDVENSRDSLYHLVFTTDQYDAYKQKKKNLITNN